MKQESTKSKEFKKALMWEFAVTLEEHYLKIQKLQNNKKFLAYQTKGPKRKKSKNNFYVKQHLNQIKKPVRYYHYND